MSNRARGKKAKRPVHLYANCAAIWLESKPLVTGHLPKVTCSKCLDLLSRVSKLAREAMR